MKGLNIDIGLNLKENHVIYTDNESDLEDQIYAKKKETPTQEYIIVKAYVGVMIPISVTESVS